MQYVYTSSNILAVKLFEKFYIYSAQYFVLHILVQLNVLDTSSFVTRSHTWNNIEFPNSTFVPLTSTLLKYVFPKFEWHNLGFLFFYVVLWSIYALIKPVGLGIQ